MARTPPKLSTMSLQQDAVRAAVGRPRMLAGRPGATAMVAVALERSRLLKSSSAAMPPGTTSTMTSSSTA